MNKNYFKGIIKCDHCGSNYIRKIDHEIPIFVCSTANNYGKEICPNSRRIKEEELVEIINNHCKIHNKNYKIQKTKLFVRQIKIMWNGMVIFYRDGLKTVISSHEIIF